MLRLICSAAVYLVLIWLAWELTNDANVTQATAIVLTGLIIVWYTYETYLLRSEAQRQTELSQRPFVVAKVNNDRFEVSNLGNGVALNVRLEPVEVSRTHQVVIKFPNSVPILKPGETTLIKAESYRKNRSAGDFFVAHLDPEYANRELSLEVRFENIDFREYVTREKIQPGSREITEFKLKKT